MSQDQCSSSHAERLTDTQKPDTRIWPPTACGLGARLAALLGALRRTTEPSQPERRAIDDKRRGDDSVWISPGH